MEKSLKRGDKCSVTGKIFWAYAASCKNGQYWLSEEKFQNKTQKDLAAQKTPHRVEWRRQHLRQKYKTDKDFRENVIAKSNQRYQEIKEQGKTKDVSRRIYQRIKSDPMQYLRHVCRARVAMALRSSGFKKMAKTESLIGCTIQELKAYLEERFKTGMKWSNRSLWHLSLIHI